MIHFDTCIANENWAVAPPLLSVMISELLLTWWPPSSHRDDFWVTAHRWWPPSSPHNYFWITAHRWWPPSSPRDDFWVTAHRWWPHTSPHKVVVLGQVNSYISHLHGSYKHTVFFLFRSPLALVSFLTCSNAVVNVNSQGPPPPVGIPRGFWHLRKYVVRCLSMGQKFLVINVFLPLGV